MTEIRIIALPREDLERMAAAFHALPVVIEHCDSRSAKHVAQIFEQNFIALLDEADGFTDQFEWRKKP